MDFGRIVIAGFIEHAHIRRAIALKANSALSVAGLSGDYISRGLNERKSEGCLF